jgi:phosphatidyl-myo-inositol alpha-mannosyltransferase
MRPLRIGIFAPYDLASAGGVQTHIRAQARALRTRGHEVTVHGPASAPLEPGEIALGATRSIRLGGTDSRLGLNPFSARHVARALDEGRFDVIHVHEPLTPLVPWLVLRRARVPVVGTFHVHREAGHQLYAAGRPVLQTLMRRVSHRIAVSDAARRTVAAHFPGAYEIVPNGIDLETFERPAPRRITLESGFRHVLFVGRIEPRKGLEHLVRAMPQVQRCVPRTRLTVIGDGPDRGRLQALATELRADVEFAGRVEDEDLVAWLQACDIVCAPSTGGESFGIVLLEAMACAKPVVASHIEGFVELLDQVDCGRLVPPGDHAGLAAALVELLNDDAKRRALGARCPSLAADFDWRRIAAKLESIYGHLAR